MDAEEKKNGLPLSDDTQEINENKSTTAADTSESENTENQTGLALQDAEKVAPSEKTVETDTGTNVEEKPDDAPDEETASDGEDDNTAESEEASEAAEQSASESNEAKPSEAAEESEDKVDRFSDSDNNDKNGTDTPSDNADKADEDPETVAKERLKDQTTAMRDAAPETSSVDEKSGLTAPKDEETVSSDDQPEADATEKTDADITAEADKNQENQPEATTEESVKADKSEQEAKPAGKTLDLNADEPYSTDHVQDDHKADDKKAYHQQEKPPKQPKQPKQQASTAAAKPKKSKKGLITAVVIIAVLAIIYFAGAAFYHTHFYMNRKINGITVGNQSVSAVASKIKNKADTYRLILKEKDNRTEKITSDALGIKYEGDDALRKLLDDQNPFIWPAALTGRGSVVTGSVISVDDSKLNLVVDSLNSVTGDDVVKAQNAQPVVGSDGNVTIKKEVSGNQIDTKTLKKVIKQTVASGKSAVDLEKQKCYIQPKYTSDSAAVKQAQQDMEKLTKASVTYTFGSDKVVVDSKVYGDWLTVDKNMKVTLDDDKLKDYLYQLALKTNTYYGKHTFKTTGGSTITVNGGNYGYRIDRDAEAKQLKEEILAGKTVTRDPHYSRKGKVRKSMYDDIGDSYVEVSIGSQHMWVYKDGNKVVDTPVVTGNVSAGNGTTPGAYYIAYKQRNAVLRGANYATPVSYWMPFNGGQGIHDSPWRGAYGGTIYRGGGSHGCVNTPPSQVPKVYANVEAGTPVIVY